MNACVIIPARYNSSRFPGKPLATLAGKPMLLWVAELSAKAVGLQNVYIATDDTRIANVARIAGYSALITSTDLLTGTDRVAEASKLLEYDIYINVQGDEPLIDPEDIKRCIQFKIANPEYIINGFTWVTADEDVRSINIPKVVVNEAGFMVYMSRAELPSSKDPRNAPTRYMKQVCIYGFNGRELVDYLQFGRKSMLERSEDIEILRFLEIDRRILMFECRQGSIAVDHPEDVAKVEAVLYNRKTE